MRSFLVPARIITFQNSTFTGPWLEENWVANDGGYRKLCAAGRAYSKLERLDAIGGTAEQVRKVVELAYGKIPNAGAYVVQHGIRTMNASTAMRSGVEKVLGNDWCGENESGETQKDAAKRMREDYAAVGSPPPSPEVLFADIARAAAECPVILDESVCPFRCMALIDAWVTLCEVNGVRNYLNDSEISMSFAIELLVRLKAATSGPFQVLRQEIEAAGGMQEWALEQYTHGKPMGLRPYNPPIIRSMSALRTSCFLHEKGVVAMGAAKTMQSF
jgi:hypothetical protein